MENTSRHQENNALPSTMFSMMSNTTNSATTKATESGWLLGHTATFDDVITHATTMTPVFNQMNPEDHKINWGFVVIYTAVIIVILVGNGLVVTAFFRFNFLQTVTNMFVVGMAITDALMTCIGIFRIVTLIDPRLLSGYIPCMIRIGSGIVNGVISSLLLTCIPFERCIGTFWPLRFQSLMTPATRVRVIIASVTITPAAVITLGMAFGNHWTPETPCFFFTVVPRWLVGLSTGTVFATLIIILIIYLLIIKTILRLIRQTVPIESVDVTRQQMTKSLKPILNLVIIVVMYAACYWPYCWATFLASGDPAGFMNNELFMKIYLGLLVMLLANCMLNPVVYALRFKPFTVAFKLMFGMIPPSERHIAIEGIQH